MKALLVTVGVSALAALLGSCAAGYAVVTADATSAAAAARDVGIIILAVLSLVGSVIAAAIYSGAAWVVGRFGGKGVAGLSWVAVRTRRLEGGAETIVERGAVRPLARTARTLTAARTFCAALVPRRSLGGTLDDGRSSAVRAVTSLARQLRGTGARAA